MASDAHSAWRESLGQYSGCIDALKDTAVGPYAERDGFVSVLNVVHGFIRPEVADRWYGELKAVVAADGAFISRKPNSPADLTPNHYTTVQFFRGPCTCKYEYAGTAGHKRFSYRNGDELGPAVLGDIEDHLGKRPFGRERRGGVLKVA